MSEKQIFALDIGTRTVVGIILTENGNSYHVKDIVVREHRERAMLDGQIHDITAVAEVIKEVKAVLEEQHGPLRKVCVAAAGRALKTERASASTGISGKPMLEREDILYLELTAVQQAQAAVAEKQTADAFNAYYCVGYSVLHYSLDGEPIGNLIDQQGDDASVEIIATFLPRVVVDSLIKALKRAGLELDALTLEPIAAINVLVPPTMRRLNVALVDVGAGTSDIALTDEGTVIAYGMVPVAGDEVTEAISDALLLDFPEAEQAKKNLWQNESILVKDILGFETTISKSEAVEQISPAIDKLASSISGEIKQLNNGKPPKAVMLVGGGSKTPELPARLAHSLGLPENRVAIRGADAIQGLSFDEKIPGGPENITPIGIAISARRSPIHYVTATVNNRTVRMFEIKRLTVGDCLVASGIQVGKLYGRPGLASFVTVNGQPVTIPGTYGMPPIILRNGEPAALEDFVSDGDEILAEKGEDGEASLVKIRDFFDQLPKKEVSVNGVAHTIQSQVIRNGKKVSLDEVIKDKDIIQLETPDTIESAFRILGFAGLLEEIRPFRITLDRRELFIPAFSSVLLLNGQETKPEAKIPDGSDIVIRKKATPTAEKLAQVLQYEIRRSITVTFNGEAVTIEKTGSSLYRNGRELKPDDLVRNGDELQLDQGAVSPFIFQDVFKYVEIDRPSPSASHFVLLNNGSEAAFHSPIGHGDRLEIIWPDTPSPNMPKAGQTWER